MNPSFVWAVLFIAMGVSGWKLYDSSQGGFHHPSYGTLKGAKAGWGMLFMLIGFGMALPFTHGALTG